MSQMLPPELVDALGGGYGGGGLSGQAQGAPPQADPLSVLQDVIQQFPTLMAALPDPKDTQDIAKALLILTGVQTRMMGSGGAAGTGGP